MKYWLVLLLLLLQILEISNYTIDQPSIDHVCTLLCSGQEYVESSPTSEQTQRQYWVKDKLEMISENVFNNTAELSNIRKQLNHLSGSDLSSIFRLTRSATFTKSTQESNFPIEDSLIKTLPNSCEEVRKSLGHYFIGRYYTKIQNHVTDSSFLAGCELREEDGWLIFQKRIDGSLSFDRSWNDYKQGFGNVESEFWLGNENLHQITRENPHRLRIEIESISGRQFYAEYDGFQVTDESDGYRLVLSSFKSGSAGDALLSIISHNGSRFSTRDMDNDKYDAGNYAVQYNGGWWFHSCFIAFLNGVVNNPSAYISPVPGNWKSRQIRSFYRPSVMSEGLVWRTVNRRERRDSAYFEDVTLSKSVMMITPQKL